MYSKPLPRLQKPYKQNSNSWFHSMDHPKQLFTENGPPFSWDSFTRFMTDQHIQHNTVSPILKVQWLHRKISQDLQDQFSNSQDYMYITRNTFQSPFNAHRTTHSLTKRNSAEENIRTPQTAITTSQFQRHAITSSEWRQSKKIILTKHTMPSYYQNSIQFKMSYSYH